MAEVKAQLNGLRIAPRKVRAVARLVKGKSVAEAAGQLEFYVKRSAPALLKLLNSAVSNAENTYHMVKENLYVKDFVVNEGVKLRRFKAKGFGRVSPIQKKTSLVKLVLAEKVAGLKRQVEKTEKPEEHTPEHVEEEKVRRETRKPEIKTEIGKKKNAGFVKKLFQRKAV